MAIVQRRDVFTSRTNQVEIFSDFLVNLDQHPVKNDIVRSVNEEAVKRSIRNLLLTNRGDRVFNNSIGSDVRSMLFEPFTPATEQIIEDLVRTTINNYEPRARILSVYVQADDASQTLAITIVFSIINREDPVTFELLLNRIR